MYNLYSRFVRNEIYLNVYVEKLVHFTHNYSCLSKNPQTKGSYWPNFYYFLIKFKEQNSTCNKVSWSQIYNQNANLVSKFYFIVIKILF